MNIYCIIRSNIYFGIVFWIFTDIVEVLERAVGVGERLNSVFPPAEDEVTDPEYFTSVTYSGFYIGLSNIYIYWCSSPLDSFMFDFP